MASSPSPPTTPRFITLRDGANQALCSTKTLRSEIDRGRLRAFRVGHKILIYVEDFEAYLRAREIPVSADGRT